MNSDEIEQSWHDMVYVTFEAPLLKSNSTEVLFVQPRPFFAKKSSFDLELRFIRTNLKEAVFTSGKNNVEGGGIRDHFGRFSFSSVARILPLLTIEPESRMRLLGGSACVYS